MTQPHPTRSEAEQACARCRRSRWWLGLLLIAMVVLSLASIQGWLRPASGDERFTQPPASASLPLGVYFAADEAESEYPAGAASFQDNAQPPANVSSPSDRPAVLYAWAAADRALAPDLLNAVILHGGEQHERVIRMARDRWAGLDAGRRCLILAPWATYQDPPVKAPIDQIVREGLNLRDQRAWWRKMVYALQKAGLTPDRVALDWESEFSYWHLVRGKGPNRGWEITLTLRDRNLHPLLPAEVLALDPTRFGREDYKTARDNVIVWNQYAASRRNTALVQAYAAPLHEVFPDARITNYRDSRYAGELVEDAWPVPFVAMSDESSPPLYRDSAEANLAILQAIIDKGGPPPVPWVSYPSYIGRDVWEQTVRGAHRLGVREFLYWNPDEHDKGEKAAGDDAFAASVIQSLNDDTE